MIEIRNCESETHIVFNGDLFNILPIAVVGEVFHSNPECFTSEFDKTPEKKLMKRLGHCLGCKKIRKCSNLKSLCSDKQVSNLEAINILFTHIEKKLIEA